MPNNFFFHLVCEDEVRQEILTLYGTKSTLVADIPSGMLNLQFIFTSLF